ncbi:MAG: hypothetical protein PVI99_04985 [Anaerolineales bacterium]|jgi:hypothetical protein
MNILSTLSKGLAALFAAAFVIVFPLMLFIFNVDQHMMQPQLYKTALEERGLYEEIPSLLAKELGKLSDQMQPDQAENRRTEAFAKVMQSLDEKDWLFMVETLMPEDWAQAQVEEAVDSIFAFLDGETETIDITVSLEALKSRLGGPQGEDVLIRLVEALPQCTASDLINFTFGLFTGDNPDLPICAPPTDLIKDNIDSLGFLLTMAADAIPNSITIQLTEEEFAANAPQNEAADTNLVAAYRMTKRLRTILPLVAGGLLVGIAVFAVRSFHGLLRWWGWPLTLGSAAAFLPAITMRNLMLTLIQNFVAARLPERLPAAFADLPLEIIRDLSRRMLSSVRLEAGLLLLVGLGMVVLGFVLSRRAREAAQEQDTPIS